MAIRTVSADVEIRVIKTILDSPPDSDVRAALLNTIRSEHFGYGPFRQAFTYIQSLVTSGKHVPESSIFSQDPAVPQDLAGYLLNDRVTKVDSIDHAAALAEHLEKYRQVRKIYDCATTISEWMNSRDEVDDINIPLSALDEASLSIKSGAAQGVNITHIGHGGDGVAEMNLVQNLLNRDKPDLIPTGLEEFDSINGGIPRGALALLVGTTGGGKTVMVNQMLSHAYHKSNLNVCLVSLEMPEEQMRQRMLSHVSRVDFGKLYRAELTLQDIQTAAQTWAEYFNHGHTNQCRYSLYCPSDEVTMTDILYRLKPYNYDIIGIDYASLLAQEDSREADWKHLKNCSMHFKRFCLANNCVGLLLAQLDEEEDRIRYSRAVKENADLFFAWRWTKDEKETGYTTVRLDKARNQIDRPFKVSPNFSVMRFDPYNAATIAQAVPGAQSGLTNRLDQARPQPGVLKIQEPHQSPPDPNLTPRSVVPGPDPSGPPGLSKPKPIIPPPTPPAPAVPVVPATLAAPPSTNST